MTVSHQTVPSGLRGIKSNLRRFLRRIGFDAPPQKAAEAFAEPGSTGKPESESAPGTGEAGVSAPEDGERRKLERQEEDEACLSEWRAALSDRHAERERRRTRDAALIRNSQRHIENLAARLDELEEDLRAAEEREETVTEPPPPPKPARAAATAPPTAAEPAATAVYTPPSPALLEAADDSGGDFVDEQTVRTQKTKLQETFDSFSVDAFVCDALVGPRVTQFRVKPGYGVKVDAISGLARNLAMAMAVKAVRVQAPIPGEPFVGVEVPNPVSPTIRLGAAFAAQEWTDSDAAIPLVMGMDMGGGIVVTDLARAPHMLIAGATGSGKSVCINNFLLSLLYRFRPDELELVLVDPKKVEFSMYQDVPHLIHPLVTDPKTACAAFKWLVREMERRYTVLAERKVRNLASYNEKAEAGGFAKMPYIVLFVDELADLMMTARQDVETPIARLAQMSRAVGIHTVLATQRPSVNVITGIIKANYPSRAAFMVSSAVDSRTILDSKGAESLQGQGDMLFNPPGVSRLLRLQSPFVEDAEILRVTDHLRAQSPPRYRAEFRSAEDEGDSGGDADDGADPLLKDALRIIAANRRASTSFLQRKLKIGYNRAARIMEELEDHGYVGPQIGQNPREVLVEPGER
ncbi:MAG: DNA translocase FtsK [Opitutales bacterium]|nr:DNA translocase FtsK [Opitutales bacterium]